MNLVFQKNNNKRTILTMYRTDGTSTWTKIQAGLEAHDIAHWAVESVLEYHQAFYGLINQGYTVADFEAPREKRPEALIPDKLPRESLVTEHIVNLLQVQHWDINETDMFFSLLQQALAAQQLPFPEELTATRLLNIQTLYQQQCKIWKSLLPDGKLELQLDFLQ